MTLGTGLETCVAGEDIITNQPQRRRDAPPHLLRDDISEGQKAFRASRGAETNCEVNPVPWAPSLADVLKVVACQCVVPQRVWLASWQVEEVPSAGARLELYGAPCFFCLLQWV